MSSSTKQHRGRLPGREVSGDEKEMDAGEGEDRNTRKTESRRSKADPCCSKEKYFSSDSDSRKSSIPADSSSAPPTEDDRSAAAAAVAAWKEGGVRESTETQKDDDDARRRQRRRGGRRQTDLSGNSNNFDNSHVYSSLPSGHTGEVAGNGKDGSHVPSLLSPRRSRQLFSDGNSTDDLRISSFLSSRRTGEAASNNGSSGEFRAPSLPPSGQTGEVARNSSSIDSRAPTSLLSSRGGGGGHNYDEDHREVDDSYDNYLSSLKYSMSSTAVFGEAEDTLLSMVAAPTSSEGLLDVIREGREETQEGGSGGGSGGGEDEEHGTEEQRQPGVIVVKQGPGSVLDVGVKRDRAEEERERCDSGAVAEGGLYGGDQHQPSIIASIGMSENDWVGGKNKRNGGEDSWDGCSNSGGGDGDDEISTAECSADTTEAAGGGVVGVSFDVAAGSNEIEDSPLREDEEAKAPEEVVDGPSLAHRQQPQKQQQQQGQDKQRWRRQKYKQQQLKLAKQAGFDGEDDLTAKDNQPTSQLPSIAGIEVVASLQIEKAIVPNNIAERRSSKEVVGSVATGRSTSSTSSNPAVVGEVKAIDDESCTVQRVESATRRRLAEIPGQKAESSTENVRRIDRLMAKSAADEAHFPSSNSTLGSATNSLNSAAIAAAKAAPVTTLRHESSEDQEVTPQQPQPRSVSQQDAFNAGNDVAETSSGAKKRGLAGRRRKGGLAAAHASLDSSAAKRSTLVGRRRTGLEAATARAGPIMRASPDSSVASDDTDRRGARLAERASMTAHLKALAEATAAEKAASTSTVAVAAAAAAFARRNNHIHAPWDETAFGNKGLAKKVFYDAEPRGAGKIKVGRKREFGAGDMPGFVEFGAADGRRKKEETTAVQRGKRKSQQGSSGGRAEGDYYRQRPVTASTGGTAAAAAAATLKAISASIEHIEHSFLGTTEPQHQLKGVGDDESYYFATGNQSSRAAAGAAATIRRANLELEGRRGPAGKADESIALLGESSSVRPAKQQQARPAASIKMAPAGQASEKGKAERGDGQNECRRDASLGAGDNDVEFYHPTFGSRRSADFFVNGSRGGSGTGCTARGGDHFAPRRHRHFTPASTSSGGGLQMHHLRPPLENKRLTGGGTGTFSRGYVGGGSDRPKKKTIRKNKGQITAAAAAGRRVLQRHAHTHGHARSEGHSCARSCACLSCPCSDVSASSLSTWNLRR